MRADAEDLQELVAELSAHERELAGSAYAERLRTSTLVMDAIAGEVPLLWAPTRAVDDLPEKIEADGDEIEATLLTHRAGPVFSEAESEIIIVSPYFVPGIKGVETLCAMVERGVRLRILTNSLDANDVTAVHAGYAPYRDDLLACGVELFEFKRTGELHREAERAGLFGSSSASLHAKSFLIDRRTVFVGSLNVDPRSLMLNTELGLVVESEELARRQLESFEKIIEPELSWRLELEDGDLVWHGTDGGTAERHSVDPETSWWRRFRVTLLRLLPIEAQL